MKPKATATTAFEWYRPFLKQSIRLYSASGKTNFGNRMIAINRMHAMYKSTSRFMQRNAGKDDKCTYPVRGYGKQGKLVVCRQCRNPVNKPVAKGRCHCGGQLVLVDGLNFLGQAKLSLANQFRKRLGLTKGDKNKAYVGKPLSFSAKDIYLAFLPPNPWPTNGLSDLNVDMLAIIVTHVPTGIKVIKNIIPEDYFSNTEERKLQNHIMANEMISEIETLVLEHLNDKLTSQ